MQTAATRRWMSAAIIAQFTLAFSQSWAFVPDERWSFTASGPTGAAGTAIALTWSIVPDGTQIPGEGASDLIAFLDRNLGQGSGGGDLKARPWFEFVDASFQRWAELGGVTFTYEPNDDGSQHGQLAGVRNVRGDIRLGGVSIDGIGDTLAFSGLPNNSDLVLDTAEDSFYSNPAGDYRRLRNTIMHEVGHGLGLFHVESASASFLMEPVIAASFDGPQFDDIRGLQWFYGDPLEKSGGGLDNNTVAAATDLGPIAGGERVVIGQDTAFDTVVSPQETDFVSVSNELDFDYYSFTIDAPSRLAIDLTPVGASFLQAVQFGEQTLFDTSSLSDLGFTLLGTDGESALAVADEQPAGSTERLTDFELPDAGEYYVRIAGKEDIVQFYELGLELLIDDPDLLGDYNADGEVNAADYTIWRDQLGSTTNLQADGNQNGVVDVADYNVWRDNLMVAQASVRGDVVSTPEPTTALLSVVASCVAAAVRRRC